MSGVVSELSRCAEAVSRASHHGLEKLSASELLQVRQLVSQMRRTIDALDHRIIAEGARKELHRAAGASSMNELIASTSGVDRKEAAKTVQLAQHLENSPVLRRQMNEPGMSRDKARVITDAVAHLPQDVTPTQRQHVEDALALAAPAMSLEQVKRKARRAMEELDRERADRLENQRLEREEATARRRASFWMTRPDSDGMVKGGFEIDALTADVLRSALESKTAPRYRARQHRLDATASGVAGTGTANAELSESSATAENPLDNPVPFTETQGVAFVDLLRHLPRDGYGNHGGVAATLMVTITEDSLRERSVAAGVTERGTPVSAGQLRQLACNAGILPAVLGSQSQVLDLGREQRLHTAAQRKALAHRDGGCAFPDCDRPPGWCESHHIESWIDGGATTIDNGVLLCGYHHRHVHNSNWRIEYNTRDSRPDFYPPGSRTPLRNNRYRPLVA